MRAATPPVSLFWLEPHAVSATALARAEAWLTEEERARHRAFVFEKNRREYLATRALVRTALSHVRPAAPETWRFVRSEYGKPEVAPACELRFNLSNHPSLVVCAVRESELALGVDVEPLARGGDVLEIASTVFSERELAELQALPPAARPERAVSLWTLKEAYIKAQGMGLSLPLKDFSFRFAPERIEISFSKALPDRPERWAFATFDRAGHRLALAVEISSGGEMPQIDCPRVPWEP